jgi:pimeloyl-ACP methyl ester carboxylesterase
MGTATDDLDRLMDFLKVDRFHVIGNSSGGSLLPDYAISHGDRLLSMTMACCSGRLSEPSFQAMLERLAVKGGTGLPHSYRELGPSYRAAYPEGVKQWEALEHVAQSGTKMILQPLKNRTHFEDIEKIRTPALLMAGPADLSAPPSVMMTVAAHLQRSEFAILSDSGHQGYWEQPIAFNRAVIEFMRKHRA